MVVQKTFEQMLRYFDDFVSQGSTVGILLWNEFMTMHPADAAQFFSMLDNDQVQELFLALPLDKRVSIFIKLLDSLKIYVLSFLDEHQRGLLLGKLSIDELTDVFDDLSDEALKEYLKLLHKKDRQKVLSLLKFDDDTAGGIMETDVITLMQDFTIEKAIKILQRLQPEHVFYQTIYITDQENRLEGYIRIEDLVLKNSKLRLSAIVRKDFISISDDMDQQEVVNVMTHYEASLAPVVDREGFFLGVITADTLVDVVEDEAGEDIYKMSALTPMDRPYFETPFFNIFYKRSFILVLLLLLQSITSLIMRQYEGILIGFLMIFATMSTSTAGNTSSQSSALIIQGLARGEINDANMHKFVYREIKMAFCLASVLGIVAFARMYFMEKNFWGSFAVSIALALIVMVSIIVGSCMPIVLKKLNFDPANSAGPILATFMDIVGILIYCVVTRAILF